MRTQPKLSEQPNEFGYYEIRWTELRAGKHRTRRQSTGKTTYGEAVQELAKFLTIRPAEEEERLSLRQAFDFYLRYHSKPRGNEKWDRQVLSLVLGEFGDWPADGITNRDLEHYARRRYVGRDVGKGPVRPTTVRREIVALQAVLNFCRKRGAIRADRPFELWKPDDDGQVRDRWLTEAQQAEIVKALPDASLDVRIFLRLGLTYGARRGAIMDLRFGPQVNFLTGILDFKKPGARESRKRRPTVPMTPTLRPDLEEKFQIAGRDGAVCIPQTPKHVKAFLTELGFGWVTPHTLKHTAITQLLRTGLEPADVAKFTATDLRTILTVYRHHTVDELSQIAALRGL